jgi:hypothetical protein
VTHPKSGALLLVKLEPFLWKYFTCGVPPNHFVRNRFLFHLVNGVRLFEALGGDLPLKSNILCKLLLLLLSPPPPPPRLHFPK